jgi:hypothetical protein
MEPGESETQTPAEPSRLAGTLDRTFGLTAAGSSVPTELRAGLATFLTMAYIMFVNPAILEKAGMDHGAVFVATCLASALSSAIMGLYANYPIALAPAWGSTPISPSPWCPSSAAIGSLRLASCSSPACCS